MIVKISIMLIKTYCSHINNSKKLSLIVMIIIKTIQTIIIIIIIKQISIMNGDNDNDSDYEAIC